MLSCAYSPPSPRSPSWQRSLLMSSIAYHLNDGDPISQRYRCDVVPPSDSPLFERLTHDEAHPCGTAEPPPLGGRVDRGQNGGVETHRGRLHPRLFDRQRWLRVRLGSADERLNPPLLLIVGRNRG